MLKRVDFSILLGKTLLSCKVISAYGKNVLQFTTTGNETFRMCHEQDCCESVYIQDITGDLNDLLNTPILQAEEVSSRDTPIDIDTPYDEGSYTWTFYKLATIKGSVTIRWFGTSNGYYSESVSLYKCDP